MVQLNDSRLLYSSLAALGVMGGTIVKNSLEQMTLDDSPYSIVGMALCLAGWGLVGYSMSMGNDNFLNYLPCLAIVVVGFLIKKHQKESAEDDNVPLYLPGICATAWFYMAYLLVSNRKITGNYLIIAYSIPVLALTGTMWSLPKQRELNIVDGPGTYLCALAWALFAFTNSQSN